jgi:predicted GIY-YIG superfamily endonuclease
MCSLYYVYILRSINYPQKIYVGYTVDINQRLTIHNEGGSTYTAKYMPWILHVYFAFKEKSKAITFEKYLKSGAGKAFAKNHFL